MTDSRNVFRLALLRLVEDKRKHLAKITVKDVVEEAGMVRQSFYNNFCDINELFGYTGLYYFATYHLPITTIEAVRYSYEMALLHKDFYMQLARLEGQNCYRDTLFDYMYNAYYRTYITVPAITDEDERMDRELKIRYSLHGGIGVFLDWCASGMTWPIDSLIAVFLDRRCDFHVPSAMEASDPPPSRKP